MTKLRLLTFSFILLLLIFPATGQAAETSLKTAKAKVLKELALSKSNQPARLFFTPHTIKHGSVLTQAGPEPGRKYLNNDSVVRFKPARVLKTYENSWLFYLDQKPYTFYQHRSKVILVGKETGRIRIVRLNYLPLVNGEVPVFLKSQKNYLSRKYVLFARNWPKAPQSSTTSRTAVSSKSSKVAQRATTSQKKEFADHLARQNTCVVNAIDSLSNVYDLTATGKSRSEFRAFFNELIALNDKIVYINYVPTTKQTLNQFTTKLIRNYKCRNILLYAAGNAYATGPTAINLGVSVNGNTITSQNISSIDLKNTIAKHPRVKFNVILDAPYTGRFTKMLKEDNLVSMLAPGGTSAPTFAYLPNPENPERLSDHTNRILTGFDRFVASEKEMDSYLENSDGGALLPWLLTRSFELTPDVAASDNIAGAPKPEEYTKVETNHPEVISDPPVIANPPVKANEAPTVLNNSVTVQEDNTLVINLQATDAENDPVEFAIVDSPTSGTLSKTGNIVTFTPANNYNGSLQFTYQATDTHQNKSNIATVAIAVTPVDDLSVANDDTYMLLEDDMATTFNVVANDTDIESDPIKVLAVTQPLHGMVVITNNGADLTYTPDANYCSLASDNFTYTITGQDTATVSVFVSCVDDQTILMADSMTVDEDTTGQFEVLANDTDADDELEITSVTAASNAVVSIISNGTKVSYVPTANYCNTQSTLDTFTYTVNTGVTQTVSVLVTCVDDAPQGVHDSYQVQEDTASDFEIAYLLSNDTDIDGGPKEIIGLYEQPLYGTAEINALGTHIRYIPNPDYCSFGQGANGPQDTVTYLLNGGSGANVMVDVSCVDEDARAVNDALSVNEDSTGNDLYVIGNDPDPDEHGKELLSVTQPLHGTTQLVDNANTEDVVRYTPVGNYCGLDTFNYTLVGGSTATVTVTVECINDAPVANDTGVGNVIGNTLFVGTVGGQTLPTGPHIAATANLFNNTTDIDGDTLYLVEETTLTMMGGYITTHANGSFEYQPPADCSIVSDQFLFTVTDRQTGGLTSSAVAYVAFEPTCVWYVDNTSTTSSGTSQFPFATLAEAVSASGVDDYIYVFTGDGTDTGLTGYYDLNNNQHLIGEASRMASPSNHTIAAAGSGRPHITGSIKIKQNSKVAGIRLTAQGFGIWTDTGTVNGTIDNVDVDGSLDVIQDRYGVDIKGAGTWKISELNVNTIGNALRVSGADVELVADSEISVTATSGTALNIEEGAISGQVDHITTSGTSNLVGAVVYNTTGELRLDDLNISGGELGLGLVNAEKITIPATGDANVSGQRAIYINESPTSFVSLNNVSANGGHTGIAWGGNSGYFRAETGVIENTGTAMSFGRTVGNFYYGGNVTDNTGARMFENSEQISGTIEIAGSVKDSNDPGGSIYVRNGSGGFMSFTGKVELQTSEAAAIEFTHAAQSEQELEFSGNNLAAYATDYPALKATGGVINISGTGNHLRRIGGGTEPGLTTTATKIADLTLSRLDVYGVSPGVSIKESEGTFKGLNVTGWIDPATGLANPGSGGVVNGGIYLDTASYTSLANMYIYDKPITGTDVRNLTLTGNLFMSGTSGISFVSTTQKPRSIYGVVTIKDNEFKDHNVASLDISNQAGDLFLAIEDNYFESYNSITAVRLGAYESGQIGNSTVSNNRFGGYLATGISVINSSSIGDADSYPNFGHRLQIQSNDFDLTHNVRNIFLHLGGSSRSNIEIINNGTASNPTSASSEASIVVQSLNQAQSSVGIMSNYLSPVTGKGIAAQFMGESKSNFSVRSNHISKAAAAGIEILSNNSADLGKQVNARVSGNTFTDTVSGNNIHIGNKVYPGKMCVSVHSNYTQVANGTPGILFDFVNGEIDSHDFNIAGFSMTQGNAQYAYLNYDAHVNTLHYTYPEPPVWGKCTLRF